MKNETPKVYFHSHGQTKSPRLIRKTKFTPFMGLVTKLHPQTPLTVTTGDACDTTTTLNCGSSRVRVTL